jgi:hypothetical protein
MDGDKEFPTISGTGTEDYFCGSYGFAGTRSDGNLGYINYTTPYSERPRATMQALGGRSGGRYLPQQDDIVSVAFCYQAEPQAPFPELPSKNELEIR